MSIYSAFPYTRLHSLSFAFEILTFAVVFYGDTKQDSGTGTTVATNETVGGTRIHGVAVFMQADGQLAAVPTWCGTIVS